MSTRKNNLGLENLRRALTASQTQHLDDAQLSELATADTAGEALETRFPQETAHLETCVPCAEAYAELVEMTLAAFEGMAEAAAAVSPLDVYTALLQRAVQTQTRETPTLARVVRQIANALPAHFPRAPATAGDIRPETITALAGQAQSPADLTPELLIALTQAVRQNLAALSLYLSGVAGSIWGRAVEVKSEVTGMWGNLRLGLAPRLAQPILGEADSVGDEWALTIARMGRPLPVNVTLQAERLSPLACRVIVRADRPGLPDAAGRVVELHFAGQTLIEQTDAGGVARFEPVPIAALENLKIRFQM